MVRAIWEETILAESDDTVQIEGNHYFPPNSIVREYFKPSQTITVCPWKGTASYYNISVGGKENRDAAWFYPNPRDAARSIKDRVAFWRGVKVL